MQGKYFGFGATSAVLTGIAVIVGLSGTTNAIASIITALVIIAIADNVSDSFGIHIHQESQRESVKEVRRTTFANFLTRACVVSVFIILMIFLPLRLAVTLSILFGLIVISVISYLISKGREANPARVVIQHLLLTITVVAASFVLRELSARVVAKFMLDR